MKIFIALYILFVAACSALLYSFSKEDIFLWINQKNMAAADNFFSVFTYLGNGYMYFIVIIGLLFVKYRYALIATISFALTASAVQVFKYFIFNNEPRPTLYFDSAVNLHLVSGIEFLCCDSFPSGHTATAFSIACMMSILFRKNLVGVICFAIAFLVGYSRIYLAQHFLLDVLFGSLIGVVISLISYWLVCETTWLNSKTKLSLPWRA